MKSLKLDAYALAQRYMEDHAYCLDPLIQNKVLGMVRARDYAGLADVTSHFDMLSLDVNHWKVLRQVRAFFSKNADFADDSKCLDAALSSFERGERICRITNRRLDYYYTHPHRMDPELVKVVAKAQRYIAEVLGSFSEFRGNIPSLLTVTSGATARTPRSQSLPFQKLGREVAVTPQCSKYLKAAFRTFGYRPPRENRIAWNRVTFVSKTWKTHRTIACEPAGNVPFQLAFDAWVKNGLRRFGYDLSDQVWNQRLAFKGSLDGAYATIDLSMASDTLAYNTVAWLVPCEWFKYLCDTRSPLFMLNGVTRKYAKFSSMGNGATFALETLIFSAIVNAIVPRSDETAVYGDDIVVPTRFAPQVMKALRFFGFVPNEEKSYLTGPFRESCGADFFRGQNITPFYLRRTDAWDKPYAAHNVNGLVQCSMPMGKTWDYLADFVVNKGLRLCPIGYDTQAGVFIHPFHAYSKGLIRLNKRGILQTKQYSRKGRTVECVDSRSLALWHLRKMSAGIADTPVGRLSISDLDQFALEHSKYTSTLVESSRYTSSDDTKYVQKWCSWVYNPAMGSSDQLFSWSERLNSQIEKSMS